MLVSAADSGLTPSSRMAVPSYMRTTSGLRATLAATGARTGPADLREWGALRLRFPRGPACEGIIVNTSGGVAGGDRQSITFTAATNARAAITTQSAEKVYRSDGERAQIATRLAVADAADLAWLPQETILFDQSHLTRNIEADVASSGRLTIKEMVVLGRTAMPEQLTRGLFHDRWRIRRDGRLIFAEGVRLEGEIDTTLAGRATGGGCTAIATIVQVASDAAAGLEMVRQVIEGAPCDHGASAWNGMLVVRLVGPHAHVVRALCGRVLGCLLPAVSPRIWSC